MTLIFMEGFDRSTNIDHYRLHSRNRISINTGVRRYGVGSLYGYSLMAQPIVARFDLVSNYTELVVGFAFCPISRTGGFIFDFLNSSLGKNVSFGVDSNGYARIYTPAGTYTSSFFVQLYAWHYVEIKARFHNTNGYFILRINGQQVLSQSNINTAASSGILSSRFISFISTVDYEEYYIDDLYVCSTSGTKNNDFLGDVRVAALFPTRNGTYNDFSVVGASSAFQAVNETNPNHDTNYVTASGIGMMQSFGFTKPIPSGAVFGVQPIIFARKDDAGSRFMQILSKLGSDEHYGSTISVSDSYVHYYGSIFETRIASTEDWSLGDLDSVEVGVKIVET